MNEIGCGQHSDHWRSQANQAFPKTERIGDREGEEEAEQSLLTTGEAIKGLPVQGSLLVCLSMGTAES